MSPLARRIGTFLIQFGLDPRRFVASLLGVPAYVSGALALRRSMTRNRAPHFGFRWLPALSDRHVVSGVARGHYFHQDLWAARRIFSRSPARHVDVGSRVDGFIAHLLVFREVDVLDVRMLKSKVAGLRFHQADLMRPGSVEPGSTESLSCLHALEHFGLGRYGDSIDHSGWHAGLCNLAHMLRAGGRLYVSVPVGPQLVEYNAQRIFSPHTLPETAASLGLRLVEFSYVDDAGDFHENSELDDAAGCQYGCGCYVFERIS